MWLMHDLHQLISVFLLDSISTSSALIAGLDVENLKFDSWQLQCHKEYSKYFECVEHSIDCSRAFHQKVVTMLNYFKVKIVYFSINRLQTEISTPRRHYIDEVKSSSNYGRILLKNRFLLSSRSNLVYIISPKTKHKSFLCTNRKNHKIYKKRNGALFFFLNIDCGVPSDATGLNFNLVRAK
ncbi:hypothetical protein HHI36_007403 [Cryptolaemus montrouzieri]|uniref:Uncharacterized protein n=1 Tax=Cryptolaemus montrouzieri TaxID=559131 RepID=A0ABD2MPX5_9CUCU